MIRVLDVSLRCVRLQTRMPFRYGIAEMTSVPHLFVIVEAEIGGVLQRGVAADHLPPKWFTKDPARGLEEEIAEMEAVVRTAAALSAGLAGETVFAIWSLLQGAQQNWGRKNNLPPLLYNFGTSLIERALIDAFCRRRGAAFHRLLRENAFGVELRSIHPELADSVPSDWLPEHPLEMVFCRHTIGLSDPLEDEGAGGSGGNVLDDGLPRSLAACIRSYGLRQFKIKITADARESVSRLKKIANVLERETGGAYAASLDGNESFKSVGEFKRLWRELLALDELGNLFGSLLFVEQPFHRDIALSGTLGKELREWADRPPILIDESDAESSSLRTALDLGYIGVSHKNCKGVFRGIANACLLAKRRREDPARALLMSGEDLANVGPVALLQDLAVQAALGNGSVERNGHHYFKGLSFWPHEIQQAVLAQHPGLYHPTAEGWPALSVCDGSISLPTVNHAPFGVALPPEIFAGLS